MIAITRLVASILTAFTMAGYGLLFWINLVFAQTLVSVRINAPDTVAPGSDFTANVTISEVQNFDATNYDVSFDSAIFRLDSITAGQVGSTTIPIDVWNQKEPGRFTVVQNVPGISGVSGSGQLAMLSFRVIGSAGQVSQINLSNGVLGNISGNSMPAVWTGDSVQVASAQTSSQQGATQSTPTGTSSVSVSTETPAVESIFSKGAIVASEDNRAKVIINKNTTGSIREGQPLDNITIEAATILQSPSPPERSSRVGSVYNFGPDGAAFDQPVTVSLSYAQDDMPAGVSEENLVIAYWDSQTEKWVNLSSQVNTEANIVSAQVSHFTAFTILAYYPTQNTIFTVSNLTVSPDKVKIAENVTISAVVFNSGSIVGNYETTLMINGTIEKTQTIEVAPGIGKKVVFTASGNIVGDYIVNVGGLTSKFTVEGAVSPAAPTALSESPPTQSKPVNWPVLWGVIGGVIVVILLIVFQVARRRY